MQAAVQSAVTEGPEVQGVRGQRRNIQHFGSGSSDTVAVRGRGGQLSCSPPDPGVRSLESSPKCSTRIPDPTLTPLRPRHPSPSFALAAAGQDQAGHRDSRPPGCPRRSRSCLHRLLILLFRQEATDGLDSNPRALARVELPVAASLQRCKATRDCQAFLMMRPFLRPRGSGRRGARWRAGARDHEGGAPQQQG